MDDLLSMSDEDYQKVSQIYVDSARGPGLAALGGGIRARNFVAQLRRYPDLCERLFGAEVDCARERRVDLSDMLSREDQDG